MSEAPTSKPKHTVVKQKLEPEVKVPNWLSPLNKIILLKALLAKAKTVTTKEGLVLTCDYNKVPGKVYVKPADGKAFVPCGWFDLEDIKKAEWMKRP